MASTPERLDALTGLRFVAAAAVFVYHVPSWLQVPAFNPGPLGQVAVGYFFVLSGFILAHVYRRDDAPLSTGRFYLARFARVWPLHAVCLLAMLVIRPASLPHTTEQGLHLLAHVALLQGWTWDSDFALAWNGPAWSLSVEALFYAVFPLLVVRRTRTLFVVYAVCCLGNAALYATADHLAATRPDRIPNLAYLASSFPLPRLQEFVLGICAHAAWRHCTSRAGSGRWIATVWEVGALAAAVMCFFAFSSGQWGAAWISSGTAPITVGALSMGPGLSWAFALTIALCAAGNGWVSWALATRGMVYLGEISYAVYLVHTPAIALVSERMQGFAFLWHVPLVVGAAVTLAAAGWLHALVEVPARQAILARGAGLGKRLHVYGAAAGVAVRARAFHVITAIGIGGLAMGLWSKPTAYDFARGIVRESASALRGVRYADNQELLGATLFANTGGLTCWIAMAGGEPAGAGATIEARTGEGVFVHTLAAQLETAVAADGTRTTVITAQAGLHQLIGASVLALVVRGANEAVVAPLSGPVGADRASLELLRLP